MGLKIFSPSLINRMTGQKDLIKDDFDKNEANLTEFFFKV